MAINSVTVRNSLPRYVSELARSAASRGGVPEDLAEYARRATMRRFSGLEGPMSAAEARRAGAYFRGVVRRQTIRSRGDSLQSMRQLYLVASIAEDLRGAGRTPQEIMAEIRADYGHHVSPDVLERLWRTVRTWGEVLHRARTQKTVDTMTSSETASNAHTRDLSMAPSADPHTSTTTHASRPSTIARSA